MKALTALILAALYSAPTFANMSCGLPPLPPLGCKVGPCLCDSMGQNCQWAFICS